MGLQVNNKACFHVHCMLHACLLAQIFQHTENLSISRMAPPLLVSLEA